MVNYKDILMTAAIISAMSTSAFAMDAEHNSAMDFVDNAKKVGTVVQRTYCDKCQSDYPTAWSFEGATVTATHTCNIIKENPYLKNDLYFKSLSKQKKYNSSLEKSYSNMKIQNYLPPKVDFNMSELYYRNNQQENIKVNNIYY